MSVIRPYHGTVWTRTGATSSKGRRSRNGRDSGSYVRKRFGVGEKFYNVSMKNGWLHFQGDGQDFRLSEHTAGLFFTPDGEAVDLRGPTFTFRNIRLYRAAIERPPRGALMCGPRRHVGQVVGSQPSAVRKPLWPEPI